MTVRDHADRATVAELARSYLANPGDERIQSRLVTGLIRSPDHPAGPIDDAVAALATDKRVNHQRLMPYAFGRLEATPAVTAALAVLRTEATLSPEMSAGVGAALSSPLMLRLLSDCLLASESVEALIVGLRWGWLDALVSGAAQVDASLELLAAIGLQMQITEWAYDETPAEADRLATLGRMVTKEAHPADAQVLVYGLYRPLTQILPGSRVPTAAGRGDRVQELFRRHLAEPASQRALAKQIPRLTTITDPVSQAVRAQYEERPYPRWRQAGSRRARRLGESVAAAIANPELAAEIDIDRPQVLIAGAGTGRHAAMTAMRYAGSNVLAIDLSIAALAYGAHQARLLNISNLRFAQADIAELATLDETFDVIECMGVLHHMSDPEQGWAELRSLVRPGGLMKLGLYSSHGRTFLDPAKAIIGARGLEPTTSGLRATRSAVKGLPPHSSARRVVSVPDFYSLSGCRDLFFHAHEDRFDLPRIQRAIAELNLEFLGFELPSPRIRDLYRRSFPNDQTACDLSNWHALEQRYPLIFSSMYRFWMRVPGR